jgi:uncharacterized membrane protein
MKKTWLIPILIVVIAAIFLSPLFNHPQIPDLRMSTIGSQTVRAEVTQILEEGTIDVGDHKQPYQIALVKILDGPYAGIPMQIDFGKRQVRSDEYRLAPGDQIIVSLSKSPDNTVNAYFVDFVRTTPMFWLAVVFAGSILLISRWKGMRSILAMAFSLFVIIEYIIPQILAGEDPLRVSILGSVMLLAVTLYITYGWTLKSHAAVLGMILALILTGILAGVFVFFTRLNGMGDENSMFLLQMLDKPISLRGLFLGGLIIGALGVLDDLVMTQASAVFELHHANPHLGFRGLYNSAMRIGQDHVAATVNTLVLAYAGGSLPMFLMFTLGHGSYGYLVNFAVVAEEIVRTLVGSLGLIAAVPLTTVIAIGFVMNAGRLEKLEQFLGPEGSGEGHAH